jgi:DNA-binding transcriptional regulator YdaS (Cro superfamily)
MSTILTPSDVIDALGGTSAVAALTGRKPSSVSTWKARNKLPAETYVVMMDALKGKGKVAPMALWGMDQPRREVA